MCLSLARLTAPTLRGTHMWQSRTSPDSKHRASFTGSLLPKSPFLPAVLSLGDLRPGSFPHPISGCGPRCRPCPPVCARTSAGESVPLGLWPPPRDCSLHSWGPRALVTLLSSPRLQRVQRVSFGAAALSWSLG